MAENVPYKEEDIQSFIDIVDNDKDGKISKPELIDFIMNLFNSMWVIWSQCYSYSFFASFIFFNEVSQKQITFFVLSVIYSTACWYIFPV